MKQRRPHRTPHRPPLLSAVVGCIAFAGAGPSCQKGTVSGPWHTGGAGGAITSGAGGSAAGALGSGAGGVAFGSGGSGGVAWWMSDAGFDAWYGYGGAVGRDGGSDAPGPVGPLGRDASGPGADGRAFGAGGSGTGVYGAGGTAGAAGMAGSFGRTGGSGGFGSVDAAKLDSGPLGTGGIEDAASWSDGKLSSCSPAPKCGINDLPVRLVSSALGIQECTCVPNPCGTTMPSCDCAGAVCTKLSSSSVCASYGPDSGYLVCSEHG